MVIPRMADQARLLWVLSKADPDLLRKTPLARLVLSNRTSKALAATLAIWVATASMAEVSAALATRAPEAISSRASMATMVAVSEEVMEVEATAAAAGAETMEGITKLSP